MRKLTALIRLTVALLLFAAVQVQVPAAQSSECTEGDIDIVTAGPPCSCADGLKTPKEQYKCLGGVWVHQSSYCGAPFCRDEGGGGGGTGGGGGSCCWWYTDCHMNSNGEYECTPTVCGLWGC